MNARKQWLVDLLVSVIVYIGERYLRRKKQLPTDSN